MERIIKKDTTFLSGDGKTKIHCVKWDIKSRAPIGILQITHGMTEYIERYDEFAVYMAKQGFLVIGHDHLGHGQSVLTEEDWGYFADYYGHDILIRDMHKLRTIMQRSYPLLPYFMLGHSMGSFLLKKYLSKYPDNLKGAIIMGTGLIPNAELLLGKMACKVIALKKGWRYRSSFIHNLAFAVNQGDSDLEDNHWLTKDEAIVKQYTDSPQCTFRFTLNGFYTLFSVIYYGNQLGNIKKIPLDLPLFLVSGEEDPIGKCGKDIKKLYHIYRKAGILDITYRLYQTDRHEILNETDRETVFADIYEWMIKRI